MRTYIFTEKERRTIRAVLEGKPAEDFGKIKYRLKTFRRLAEDVSLYLKIREFIGAGSA